MNKRGAVQLICTNKNCINKSPVWRKIDATREHLCKKCSELLHIVKADSKMKDWNRRAKKELRELNA